MSRINTTAGSHDDKDDTVTSKQDRFFLLKELLERCETMNEFLIIEYLIDQGPATRGDIVKGTPVKRTTAHDALVRMHVKGLVKREVIRSGRGRPRVMWSLKLSEIKNRGKNTG